MFTSYIYLMLVEIIYYEIVDAADRTNSPSYKILPLIL